jgi:hypothetical protein
MKPKTEIEVTLIETIRYSKRSERVEAYCAECGSMAEFMTPQTAAIAGGVGEREIYRLIDRNAVHFVERDRVWVCMGSLAGHQKELGE